MIVRGFKSVLWVGAVGGAALSCYMVSLRVATERADLVRVERQIVDTKRDIRTLETELDTRGRLTQLEDWNSNVLALSAPSSSQFVKDGYQLAQLATHEQTVGDRTSAVRMASVETGQAVAPTKTDAAPQPKPAEEPKPKVAPVAPPPAAVPMPRVVEAVAPATPQGNVPVRRASFETIETPAAPPTGKPAKGKAAMTAAKAPVASKKVKTAAKAGPAAAPAGHDGNVAARTARADAKAPAKPAKAHSPAKLARADSASHPQSSGHRGGAQ